VCASCHLASAAQIPIAPEEPSEASNPRMLAHAIAADRLWAGLTLPSDETWASGMQLLLQDPGLADPSVEVSAAARLLRELARRGERTEPAARGQLLADVLLTCSGCHERLGVVLEDGVVVR
jgi:cytochrome c553